MDNIQTPKKKKHIHIGAVIVYILLSVWAIIVIFPFYWMTLTSVKS